MNVVGKKVNHAGVRCADMTPRGSMILTLRVSMTPTPSMTLTPVTVTTPGMKLLATQVVQRLLLRMNQLPRIAGTKLSSQSQALTRPNCWKQVRTQATREVVV